MAKSVTNYEGYNFAIRRYTEGFNDGHLSFWTNYDKYNNQWPNFIISYRAGNYVVSATQTKAVQEGDILKSCDGSDLRTLFKINIHQFAGEPIPKTKMYRFAPLLLVDKGNPFITLPKNCTFERRNKSFSHQLTYQKIKRTELNKIIMKAIYGEAGPFLFKAIARNSYWISIPTFAPDKKNQIIMKEYIEKLKKIKNTATSIVFDVRGNGGGSSQWGESLLSSLNGQSNVEIAKQSIHGNITIDWRVSNDNFKAIEQWPNLFIDRFGAKNQTTLWASKFIPRFKKALENKKVFIQQDNNNKKAFEKTPSKSSIFNGNVYLLTDGACGSACLDFADLIRSFKNTTHIGLETSADTVYMEGNIVVTPSALGSLYYPMKVWRGRLRGNQESYKPHHYWNGEISDTKKLQKWIINNLKVSFNPQHLN